MDTLIRTLPPKELYLFRTFSPVGYLSQVLPGYQMRESQLRLAQRIDRAITEGEDLAAEGPVGLGKSMAYCVPLAYHSHIGEVGSKSMVVTANIALQEQLIKKDLPLLQSALPWEFDFALLKGKNNFLCKNALRDMTEKLPDGRVRLRMLDDQDNTDHHMRVAAWGGTTKTGDRSELSFEPLPKVWSRFSVTHEECLGRQCQDFDDCFANKARENAEDRDIVVTNYHMYFAGISNGAQSGLPRHDFVVLDEAHAATEIARSFFGFTISESSIRWVSSRLSHDPILRDAINASAAKLFRDLKEYKDSPKYGSRIEGPLPLFYQGLLDNLTKAKWYFGEKVENFKKLDEKIENARDKAQIGKMVGMAERSLAATNNLINRLNSAFVCRTEIEEDTFVYFLDEEREHITVRAKRIEGGPVEDEGISQPVRILLSATLAVGGSFDHVVGGLSRAVPEVHLSSGVSTFVAESPFHWPSQAKLIIPEDFPSPRDKEAFQAQVALALGYIVEQAQGRTLALFTSWSALEAAYKALNGKTKYRLLKQGDLPRIKLIEEFKKDKASVLFGVESFWSGIDVPGEALSCVVIDKLPFPNVSDPVLDALEARMQQCSPIMHDPYAVAPDGIFVKHSIPRMILAMKQGFGRLIRSVGDRGVVVVLDKRVHTQWRSYGKLLVHSLPPVNLSTDLDDVGRFLK